MLVLKDLVESQIHGLGQGWSDFRGRIRLGDCANDPLYLDPEAVSETPNQCFNKLAHNRGPKRHKSEDRERTDEVVTFTTSIAGIEARRHVSSMAKPWQEWEGLSPMVGTRENMGV